ncbi:S1/P1 nuclease [Polaribacter sp. R77954]|uniref:S1/P1 nuclease n=1 Tax=Polaribacter sp. R77954 TaxID=3093870 RepID=UPI0037C83E15
MKLKILMFAPLFFLLNPTNNKIDFWGKNGHRVTGKIAEKHLTKRAKKKIDKLLNGQSLAFVSTFADEIKSDSAYSKYYSWHYVNMDLDETYEEAEKNPKGDLVTGIDTCVKVLKDQTSSVEEKAFHLKLLVHFIGDLHQPMHVGRKEDKGGNDVQVQWFGKGTNLHSVWDSKMIDDYKMSYTDLADNAEHLSKKQIEALQKGSVIDWVNEVHKTTKKVYSSVKVGENLRYRYSFDYFGIVRTQLQKSGIRLAKVLNDIFD